MAAPALFEQVHDILHRARARERPRTLFHLADSPGLVQEGENFVRQPLGRQFVLRQQASGACVLHRCGIARLVRVGGGAEGDEDGGASGGGISATVIAPERQTIKSAWANRSAIFSMKGTTSARNSRRA